MLDRYLVNLMCNTCLVNKNFIYHLLLPVSTQKKLRNNKADLGKVERTGSISRQTVKDIDQKEMGVAKLGTAFTYFIHFMLILTLVSREGGKRANIEYLCSVSRLALCQALGWVLYKHP